MHLSSSNADAECSLVLASCTEQTQRHPLRTTRFRHNNYIQLFSGKSLQPSSSKPCLPQASACGVAAGQFGQVTEWYRSDLASAPMSCSQQALHLLPSDCESGAAEGTVDLVWCRIHWRRPLKVQGPNHHGGGAQGVAGAFEVMPLDAIELSVILPSCVEHPIEIGGATGIKPPPWNH